MARILETNPNGSGLGRVFIGRYEVASVRWGSMCVDGQCIKAAEPKDVLNLVTDRLADRAEVGLGSPEESQAIALIEQAKTLLAGGQTEMPDGTPILGATE